MNWPPAELPEYIGYDEFVCSETLARELMNGGMSIVNEVPVYLQHVDTMRDGRWILHVWPKLANEASEPLVSAETIAA